MQFQTIGFIGLGLIGGSIAKKIKSNAPNTRIIATAGRESTIEEAYSLGLIENEHKLPLSDFHNCDIIFLCAPVQKNLEYLNELKNIIKPDCIITDVGSTKTEIHEKVIELQLEKNFIGGHPMTGSEKTGIANANLYLLENAFYIITPTTVTTEEDLSLFKDFIASLGSIPLILDYVEHDHATASISHLPHLISFSLVNLIKDCDDENETMKTIAAGGFRDITRIASSSPVMWQNICLSNKDQIVSICDQYIKEMTKVRNYVANSQNKELINYFQSAKDYRDSISVPGRKHATIFEIYMDLKDETGGIASISCILALKGINIKNIGIIHNREFEEGVLRIEFYDQNALDYATKLLQAHNYILHNR